MGYQPETLVASFPPYRWQKGSSLARMLASLEPFIGFDIWHIDPERDVPGQRRDDSCGWFPRNLTPGLQRAVDELCGKGWEDLQQRVQQAFDRWTIPDARYPSLKEMPMDVAFATHLMVLTYIDRLAFKRRRGRQPTALLVRLASGLAFSTVDNLNGAYDGVDRYIRLLAAAYRRELRPWWRHPRWHVHHWQVKFNIVRNVRRMFQRCAGCGRPLGWNHCPVNSGGKLYHSDQNRNCAYASRGAHVAHS